jgi:hypothetical protein
MSDGFSLPGQIRRYSIDLADFFAGAGQRSSLISPLFNTPARLVCGSHCYFEHGGWFVRRMLEAADPREMAERMKLVASLPNFMTINALMIGYFCGREQERLLAGLSRDEALQTESREDTEAVVRFWAEMVDVYVEDGRLPSENGHQVRILPEPAVSGLAQQLRDPGDDERRAIRRATALIELYTFILNGEARVGVFHHGPYALPGGDVLVVKELVGLRQDFLPWKLNRSPEVDAVARVMRLHDVALTIDAFGSLATDPLEYESSVVAEYLLAREGNSLRPLGTEELQSIADAAADAQGWMYEQASRWDPTYQVAYGADLYAALAYPLGLLAGIDLREELRTRFHATADRVAEALRSGAEPLLIIGRLSGTSGDELLSTVLPEPTAARGSP